MKRTFQPSEIKKKEDMVSDRGCLQPKVEKFYQEGVPKAEKFLHHNVSWF